MLPSSLISLSIHLAILVFASLSLRGCDRGAPAPAGGQDFQEIGLAVLPSNSTNTENPAATNSAESEPQPLPQIPPQPPSVPDDAPSVTELLNDNASSAVTNPAETSVDLASTIGPGRPVGGVPEPGGGLAELIRPQNSAGGAAAGSLTPGPGETSFMNIIGNGRSFVYVIDTSSSMSQGRRLDLAKSQLKGSLRLLKPNQKFQVLFYNESATPIRLRRRPEEDLYAATTVQVQLAEAAIDMETANLGTNHLPALQQALMLQPDVVYFLTDGEQPGLTKEELLSIKRSNRSKAQIHVIEFAAGARESRHVSWLQQLASQSGGEYRYVPVR